MFEKKESAYHQYKKDLFESMSSKMADALQDYEETQGVLYEKIEKVEHNWDKTEATSLNLKIAYDNMRN